MGPPQWAAEMHLWGCRALVGKEQEQVGRCPCQDRQGRGLEAGGAGTPGEAQASREACLRCFSALGGCSREPGPVGARVGTRQGWTDLSGLAPSLDIRGAASVALQLVSSPAVSLAYTCVPSLGDWPCWLSLMSSQEDWVGADGIAVDGASPTEALASPRAPSWVSVLGRTQASVTTVPGSLWSPLCEVGLQLLPSGHANCQVHRRAAPVPSPLDSPGPRALVRA